jgi:hypothetical protein
MTKQNSKLLFCFLSSEREAYFEETTGYSIVDGSLTGKSAQRGQLKNRGFLPRSIDASAINFLIPIC